MPESTIIDTISRVIHDILNQLFIRKPCVFINDVRAGIPEVHQGFWRALSYHDFYDMYMSMSMSMQATPAKVLSMLSEVTPSTPKEEAVSYLCQYIGNMRRKELRVSSVCIASRLTVCFNNVEGLARRPVVHTCGYTIELSTTYASYSEFSQEFSSILSSKEAQMWSMDCV